MDAHDAHRAARRLSANRLEVLARFLHAAQQAHEREQTAEALPLERPRPLEESEQVGLPLRAVGQRAVQAERSRLVIDLPQQTVHRLVAREAAQEVQPLQEHLDLRESAARLYKRVVIACLAVCQPDIRQLLLGEAEQRRTQHADQVHVLPRVVDHVQERNHRAHLGGFQQAAALLRARGNARLLKRGDERARLGFGGAQQDHDIPRRNRT